ncbi:hypothetical protein V8F33_009838 [Rhypophila sp. PSN 637]
MIFTTVTRVVATVLALGGVAVAFPTPDADAAAADKPVCPTVKPGYWECLSDCLYKTCKTGDTTCINRCDNVCSKCLLSLPWPAWICGCHRANSFAVSQTPSTSRAFPTARLLLGKYWSNRLKHRRHLVLPAHGVLGGEMVLGSPWLAMTKRTSVVSFLQIHISHLCVAMFGAW